MKKSTLLLVFWLAAIGCSQPLEKKYGAEIWPEDLNEIYESGKVDSADVALIAKHISISNAHQVDLREKTYAQILREAPAVLEQETERLLSVFDQHVAEQRMVEAEEVLTNVLEVNGTHAEVVRKAVAFYARKEDFERAQAVLEQARDTFEADAWLNLAERLVMQQDMYTLIEVGKGAVSQASSRDLDENASIWERVAATGPDWSVSSEQKGFVANHSQTLTVDMEVTVAFTVTRKTSVTFLFTVQKIETETVYRTVVLQDVKPGEVRPFSVSIRTGNLDYGDFAQSRAWVSGVNVRSRLLTSMFE